MKKYSPVKHYYSLVELLVVVALAAILFGIGLPAFNVLTKGNAMTASINDVAGKIKATRAYAVSNNCYTALLFPCYGNDDGRDMTNLSAALINRACRPCIVQPRDNETKWYFDSWIDGENWKMLENGIIFSKEAKRVSSGQNVAFTFFNTRIPLKQDWEGSSYPTATYETTDNLLAPKDGSRGRYEIQIPQEMLAEHGAGDVVFYRVMIFRPNGQLLQNTFLTLQEGVNTGSDVTATQDTPVYYALGVNKYNGKVTYYEPVSPQ